VLAPAVHAQASDGGDAFTQEFALAYPRVVLRTAPEVAWPHPLTPSDAALSRRIFVLQVHGRLAEAGRLTAELASPLLLGTIYADRYLGRFHRSTPEELRTWLDEFAGEADAPAIYALLLRRMAKGAKAPPVPPAPSLAPDAAADAGQPTDDDPQPGIRRDPKLDRAVAARLQRDNAAGALHLVAAHRRLDPAYAALLRAEVARTLFATNRDTEALKTALGTDHRRVAEAGFIGGLAAWRLGRIEQARELFEAAGRAPVASASIRAAASFWAARANARLHQAGAARAWARKAAADPGTLYGLLARRILGLRTGIIPNPGLLTQADVDAVAALPAGRRAFALLQVEQRQRAAAELRLAWAQVKNDAALRRSVLLVATAAGLHDLAGEFAMLEAAADGNGPPAPPVPPLKPALGFQVDPALVYALTRTESNFDPDAQSAAGARGLMQIMPVTAQFVAGDSPLSAGALTDPGVNLALGQRYVLWLAQQDPIGGDLLRLLAGYNLGVGGLAHVLAGMQDHGDPLLFLEAIPVAETRGFVRDVLTWSWLYAAQLHVPAPSLDALAAGEFPRFTPLPEGRKMEQAALHDG
jgi:soluble lytic murein transglycosylase-like protein